MSYTNSKRRNKATYTAAGAPEHHRELWEKEAIEISGKKKMKGAFTGSQYKSHYEMVNAEA